MNKFNDQVVCCLKCEDLYLHKFGTVPIETCPHCGNPDMFETIYLEDSQVRREFLMEIKP